MSSMEVETSHPISSFSPNTNGTPQTASSPITATVQFSATTEVKTYKSPTANGDQRPKHKARRRARLPKIDTSGDAFFPNGSVSSPTQQGMKPLSPSKLKKMSEKDRHSRTGRRGMPKKGKSQTLGCSWVWGLC